ncbi:MAG TPA: hypothetical protein VLW54_15505 [Candidatus Acidoferrales bacterium]|nr:hypothetical protein [Candidatus Acidoferrales bacterium]
MQSTKSSRGFLLALLMVVVLGLTALNIYQDQIIHRQQYELRWLLTHSTIRPDVPAPAAAKNVPGAPAASHAQTPAPSVAEVPPASKPVPSAPTAKP